MSPEFSKFQIFWDFRAVQKIYIQQGTLNHLSVIYSYQNKRLFKDLQVQKVENGRFLYDPFMEYSRLGVKISLPSTEQLATMIFGQIIDQHLLAYLLNTKPQYKPEHYLKSASALLTQNIQNIKYGEEFSNQLINFYYDPRCLFDSDQQFYTTLEAHPQNTKEFLQNYEITQKELKEQLIQDEKLSEEASDSQPALIAQTKSIFKNIKNAVKQQFQQNTASQPQVLQHPLVFASESYGHGLFFKSTYFLQSPVLRYHLKNFISNKLPKFDSLHSPQLMNNIKISYLNTNYLHSPTYPCILAVPIALSDSDIVRAMKFRSRGRACTLSYNYKSATLSRSAQPGSGFGLSRENEDEKLLKEMSNNKLIVFDARPKISAIGNVLSGKGFESKSAYPFAQTYYCGIQNIHAIRDSQEIIAKGLYDYLSGKESAENMRDFSRIQDIIQQEGTKSEIYRVFYSSKWFDHLQLILFSSNSIAQLITEQKQSVMVHCSDGWDRTSQLTSISMLLMDNYYRTIRGFLILIQKEWLSFGHMFATRNRQFASTKASRRKDKEYFSYVEEFNINNTFEERSTDIINGQDPKQLPLKQSNLRFSASQTSPIFFQFLDAVYQVIMQHPTKFEFNSDLLVFLAIACMSGKYGDFQCDNERMRVDHSIYTATSSCFDYIIQNPDKFVNVCYRNVDLEKQQEVISCSWVSQDLTIFWELWNQY
eukprot:EST49180.1 Myotubularin-related family protein [Spironucleus salmonicida]